jgi:glycosyltransferase involved in cell wall biosynthesis
MADAYGRRDFVTGALRAWIRTWQAEGTAAVRDRISDRWAERRERDRAASGPPPSWPTPPVLNVLGVEAAARLGDVPLQALARLRHEGVARSVALLSRAPGGLRLEWRHAGQSWARLLPCPPRSRDPLAPDPKWLGTVRAARKLVGAPAIHVENLADLSLPTVETLAKDGPCVLSFHDFGAFCRRPHLWESAGDFCGYSTDAARCRTCLEEAGAVGSLDQDAHRALASAIAGRATGLVFSSPFLREQLAGHLRWSPAIPSAIVEPGIEAASGATTSSRRPDRVAFLGGGADHKGGQRLARLPAILAAHNLSVTIYGGNGHHRLAAIGRVDRVHVRGYYRAGSLPALLARQGASVAVLLPRVPETFSLALSEAWAAGVPVVAAAQGALVDRLAAGGGILLGAVPTDHEVSAAVDLLRSQSSVTIPPVPTAAAAARHMLELYRTWRINPS